MHAWTEFDWYFRLASSRKRAIDKAIRLLVRAGFFRTPQEALEFLHSQNNRS
jgi:hypothetical protein